MPILQVEQTCYLTHMGAYSFPKTTFNKWLKLSFEYRSVNCTAQACLQWIGKKVGGGDVTGPVRLPFARKRKEKKRKKVRMECPPPPYGTGFAIKAHENTVGQAWLWQMIQKFSGHFSCKGKGQYIRVFPSVEWTVPFKFPTKNSSFCWQMVNCPHITYNWKSFLPRSHSSWSFWMEASTSLFKTKLIEALAKKSDNFASKTKIAQKLASFRTQACFGMIDVVHYLFSHLKT